MPDTDVQLLIRTRRGHEPSASGLWERFGPRLAAYASCILKDPGAGDDVAQEVFLRILSTDERTLRAIDDAQGWLFRVARNLCVSRLRSDRSRRARDASAGFERATGASGDEVSDLDQALQSLPRRLREVVVLKHSLGLTFDQLSATLGINRNTLAARYSDALARLRAMLVPEGLA